MFMPQRVHNPESYFQARDYHFPDDWDVPQEDPPKPKPLCFVPQMWSKHILSWVVALNGRAIA